MYHVELEFRGKRLDDGQWAYGDLIRRGGRNYFIYADSEDGETEGKEYPVEAATISVFTGFRDKEGQRIYEGDKVGFYYKGETVVCEVIWNCSLGLFCLKWNDGYINQHPLNPERYKIVD